MIRKMGCAVIALAIFLTGCSQSAADISREAPTVASSGSQTAAATKTAADISAEIPANASVNYAWGGSMCEAGGLVYYVSAGGKGTDGPVYIARMNPDGSGSTAATGEYSYLYGLTADDNNIYFMASTDRDGADEALYALDQNGGGEKKIKLRDWKFGSPQAAGGRLYWEQDSDPDSADNITSIMSMNPDGTEALQLFSVPVPYGDPFYFLATPNGLYYSCPAGRDDGDACALFHTDLQGQNKVQLNKQNLDRIDKLFYDENNLYFITLNHDKGDGLYSTVNRMDENGGQSVILQHIDYFPQDQAINAFCGVSGNIFYYFDVGDSSGIDIHSYDIARQQDKILAKAETKSPPALHSIKGKTIGVQSVAGLYILGNDVYYGFFDFYRFFDAS